VRDFSWQGRGFSLRASSPVSDFRVKRLQSVLLVAYLCTQKYQLDSGCYSADPFHGYKNREKLMIKHPALYHPAIGLTMSPPD
jgi:hypothetical protein